MDGIQALMEDNILWKTTLNGRTPFLEKDLRSKIIFDGKLSNKNNKIYNPHINSSLCKDRNPSYKSSPSFLSSDYLNHFKLEFDAIKKVILRWSWKQNDFSGPVYEAPTLERQWEDRDKWETLVWCHLEYTNLRP